MVGGKTIQASTGSFVYGPRDIPHTFMATSPQARFLLVTERAGFEKFVRMLGEPAAARTIPPRSVQLPSLEQVISAAAQFGSKSSARPALPIDPDSGPRKHADRFWTDRRLLFHKFRSVWMARDSPNKAERRT